MKLAQLETEKRRIDTKGVISLEISGPDTVL